MGCRLMNTPPPPGLSSAADTGRPPRPSFPGWRERTHPGPVVSPDVHPCAHRSSRFVHDMGSLAGAKDPRPVLPDIGPGGHSFLDIFGPWRSWFFRSWPGADGARDSAHRPGVISPACARELGCHDRHVQGPPNPGSTSGGDARQRVFGPCLPVNASAGLRKKPGPRAGLPQHQQS